jgi:hypothetical protein
MMNQFKRVFYPGGMSLDHSAWWLVRVGDYGMYIKIRKLATTKYD